MSFQGVYAVGFFPLLGECTYLAFRAWSLGLGRLSAKRCCDFDWAAVAVEATAPRHVVGTLQGPLPGCKQAEAYAMSMLFRLTQGPRRFCSDSLACVKWVRKLRPQSYFEKNKKDAEQEKELLTALTDTREEPSASEKGWR